VRRDLAFAGLGGWSGPANPERLDREVAALEAMSRPAAAPLVLVSHNVPFGSSLDGVNNPDLPDFAQGKMVGSHRCRAVMAALSPSLCLAGHLHENYGRTERIGETLCICGARRLPRRRRDHRVPLRRQLRRARVRVEPGRRPPSSDLSSR
jgi:hypothetical protein